MPIHQVDSVRKLQDSSHSNHHFESVNTINLGISLPLILGWYPSGCIERLQYFTFVKLPGGVGQYSKHHDSSHTIHSSELFNTLNFNFNPPPLGWYEFPYLWTWDEATVLFRLQSTRWGWSGCMGIHVVHNVLVSRSMPVIWILIFLWLWVDIYASVSPSLS